MVSRRREGGAWDYNYAPLSQDTTSYSDTAGITPGVRYDYNVKSCRPSERNCAEFAYGDQVSVRCPTPTPYCVINDFALTYKAMNGAPACEISGLNYTDTGWATGWAVQRGGSRLPKSRRLRKSG